MNSTITKASATFLLERKNPDNSWTAVPATESLPNPITMTVGDTADGSKWKAVWESLPRYELVEDNVKEIQYRVVETAATVSESSLTTGATEEVIAGAPVNIDNYLPVDLTIIKVDSAGMTRPLKGAVFTIQQINEQSAVLALIEGTLKTAATNGEVTGETGTDGVAVFTGLTSGYYIVKETKLPDGYVQTGTGSFFIKVDQDKVMLVEKQGEDWVESDGNEKLVFTAEEGDDPAEVKVGNDSGVTLPSTGGIGTNLFKLLGSILVMLAGAGFFLLRGKRSAE